MAYKNPEDKLTWQRNMRARQTPEERERIKSQAKLYRAAHKETLAARQVAWRAMNKERKAAYAKTYHAQNREAELARMKAYKQANKAAVASTASQWKLDNRARANVHEQNRKASKRGAVPPWYSEFDDFVMQEAADLCKLRKTATGIDWQIDHVVPLVSKLVCGLHVAANLAVIPAKMNQSKGNRHWPDMP